MAKIKIISADSERGNMILGQDSLEICYPVCMSHIEFMQYLQSQAGSDAQHKPVTRLYKNNAGADVMVHLPQSYWDYVD